MQNAAGNASRSRNGVAPEQLLRALKALSQESLEGATRERAARTLVVQLHRLIRSSALRDRVRRLGNGWSESVNFEEDTVQHVALVASTGRARFRGTHEGEAVVWCSNVMLNYLRSELRWQIRQREHARLQQILHAPASSGTIHAELSDLAAQERTLALCRLRTEVLTYLCRTRNPRAARSLFDAVCCYLDYVMGTPLCEQLERWCHGMDPCNGGAVRARNRVYQYHRRGKLVLREFLSHCSSRIVDTPIPSWRGRNAGALMQRSVAARWVNAPGREMVAEAQSD